MGQKANPIGLRIGFNKNWKSTWFASKDDYRKRVLQDYKVREYLKKRLETAGVDKILISRSLRDVTVEVQVARPGVVIGRGGEGINQVKKELSRMISSPVDFKVKEIANPDTSAKVIAKNIAEGMKRGFKHRTLMSKEVQKAMSAGVKGIKIWVSGDFASPKHSRVDKTSAGFVPLQTLRSNIDYAHAETTLKNAGLHGIKVWINLGEKNTYDLEVGSENSEENNKST